MTLDKKLISDENLLKIFDLIERYKNEHPEKIIELELFGGEPLLISNEAVIDKVLCFCKKNALRVHITTNGSFLDYFLKKLIIHRNFISSINSTLDTMKLNYVTRYSMDDEKNNEKETIKLLKCIKTLITYGIHVNLSTNVDRLSYENIENYKIPEKNWVLYPECADCNIRGFCGGGCQLSHKVDFERTCQYEKESFSFFMKNIFKPIVNKLLEDVNE